MLMSTHHNGTCCVTIFFFYMLIPYTDSSNNAKIHVLIKKFTQDISLATLIEDIECLYAYLRQHPSLLDLIPGLANIQCLATTV